ncbi:hypothetical protein D5R81_19755 [Parashewanella spongiae]|uniref:Uncharacterized protein n=1 Tax=Parashewanella spongiae TaxID=342950 RepID=A0A3A6TA42_9GAMM|nr:hypothetical protein [Parashewanella spongiae]MCL1080263.1 hypothetical protein [Parashewanella spongiae]RJY01835.1 hypothetical protein D5R81_19755 [Parashewanella spongiae]
MISDSARATGFTGPGIQDLKENRDTVISIRGKEWTVISLGANISECYVCKDNLTSVPVCTDLFHSICDLCEPKIESCGFCKAEKIESREVKQVLQENLNRSLHNTELRCRDKHCEWTGSYHDSFVHIGLNKPVETRSECPINLYPQLLASRSIFQSKKDSDDEIYIMIPLKEVKKCKNSRTYLDIAGVDGSWNGENYKFELKYCPCNEELTFKAKPKEEKRTIVEANIDFITEDGEVLGSFLPSYFHNHVKHIHMNSTSDARVGRLEISEHIMTCKKENILLRIKKKEN